VTAEQKLARIYRVLANAGIETLVMGGHAARYYGVSRNTVDFDLVTAICTPEELHSRVPLIAALGPLRQEPAWRKHDFVRYEIGKLDDGREEWLEFWLHNHLLDEFPRLKYRAETGQYGGEQLAFLGLSDLIRSKETERESDWKDIELLEEICDERAWAKASSDPLMWAPYLSTVRSRRAMDLAVEKQLVKTNAVVEDAFVRSEQPVPAAFLFPYVNDQRLRQTTSILSSTFKSLLSNVEGGSPKHFLLIEVVRRDYKRRAMERDRADKQERLRKLGIIPPPPPPQRID
jgi:hypothetical protein